MESLLSEYFPILLFLVIAAGLAVVMIGGLVTSTLFTLLVLPTFYMQVHGWMNRRTSLHEA
jgi:multidrug efflux pump subunit AcrB